MINISLDIGGCEVTPHIVFMGEDRFIRLVEGDNEIMIPAEDWAQFAAVIQHWANIKGGY